MASLSDLKQATEAAFDAAKEFDEMITADIDLLVATDHLLCAVRSLRKDRKLRSAGAGSIVEHKKQLAGLMEKYAVKLVPNATCVGEWDLQVVGTAAAIGTAENTCMFPAMESMDVVKKDGGACASKSMLGVWAQYPQPKSPLHAFDRN